ncbi:MAG: hypothetical protein AAGM67_14215, partial [Bacteroidota bacterium]
LNVVGTDIPFGTRSYWVVYEFHTDEITLTYPYGGESFVPGETQRLHWDAQPISGTFTLEYTLDDGATWLPMATVPGNVRMYDWTVPSAITDEARVRISRGGQTSESAYNFTIIEVPQGLNVDYACDSLVSLSWSPVSGATEYEVYLLGDQYMEPVQRTTDLSACIQVSDLSREQWFAVSAVAATGGISGRRTFAISYNGPYPNCTSSDAGFTAVTSSNADDAAFCIFDTLFVSVLLSNNGSSTISNIPYGYQLDAGNIINGSLTDTLASCEKTIVDFVIPLANLNGGIHFLTFWTGLAGDQNLQNDTLVFDFATIDFPYSENFETFDLCGTDFNCDQEICDLKNGWTNLSNGIEDAIDWRVNEGPTPSNGTGPVIDHNPGTSQGNYLYLEASNGCFFQE